MQRIVIDTNVIVSALISRGIPSRIVIELILGHEVELQLSSEVFTEYVDVLMRPKFVDIPNFQTNAEIVLNRMAEIAVFCQPNQKVTLIRDDADNRFLELALSSNADYLITGNSKHFDLSEIGNTKVLSPSLYWQAYHPNQSSEGAD